MTFKPGLILVPFFLIFQTAGFAQVRPVNAMNSYSAHGSKTYHSELANTGQFGLTFGPAIYHGDLNVGNFSLKRSTGLAASIFGQYYFSNVFGFRMSLYSGILNGGIKTYELKGIEVQDSFTGVMLEGDLHIVINFSNLFFGSSPSRRFIFYGMLGLGYSGWYSKLTNKVYNYDSLQYDNPLTNFNASFVLPAGLGCYYRIGNRLNLGLEYSYKTYFSDKLDNTVAGYPYDVVHYLALNISFNLGTGLAKDHAIKAGRTQQLQTSEYPVSSPSYTPVYTSPASAPPAALPAEQPAPAMNFPGSVSPAERPRSKAIEATIGGLCYSVQIFAFERQTYSAEWIKKRYHITDEIRREKQGDTERFVVGRCSSMDCARKLKEKMKKLGISGAFIVTYKNGRRNYPEK